MGKSAGDHSTSHDVFMDLDRHQSRSALAVSSGPVSQRMYPGAVPRTATIRSSVAAVASALMRLAATIASASRVCSSTMLSRFRTRPSAVWSNWKSSAQTWSGRSALSRLAG